MALDNGVARAAVTIGGERLVLRGEGQSDYLERLAARVDARLHDIARTNPRLTPGKAAVLCALNLADELAKLEEQYERVLGMLEKEWERRKRELGETGEGGENGEFQVSGGSGQAAAARESQGTRGARRPARG